MKQELSDEQIRAIKKVLDDAIETGPWSESNFLKVIGKNLQDIRDTFLAGVGHHGMSNTLSDSSLAHRVALRSNQKEIYISLYASEGGTLFAWERLLANLPKHVTSRPIYAEEEEVKKLIRAKDKPVNEAYVAVYVDKTDILDLPPERVTRDRYGIMLLTLKDRTIQPENITRFVHRSGVYKYVQGRLKPLHIESEKVDDRF